MLAPFSHADCEVHQDQGSDGFHQFSGATAEASKRQEGCRYKTARKQQEQDRDHDDDSPPGVVAAFSASPKSTDHRRDPNLVPLVGPVEGRNGHRQQERKGSAIYANVCGDAFAWPGCCREEKGHDREEEEHHKGTWCANLRPAACADKKQDEREGEGGGKKNSPGEHVGHTKLRVVCSLARTNSNIVEAWPQGGCEVACPTSQSALAQSQFARCCPGECHPLQPKEPSRGVFVF
mmetsp:Transcript_83061/g.173884  ORF Transcript_83061/g.173884 Transcript_83061/m.173884 type:complete len:235 (+) Transcript_83061:583-1287(+)